MSNADRKKVKPYAEKVGKELEDTTKVCDETVSKIDKISTEIEEKL